MSRWTPFAFAFTVNGGPGSGNFGHAGRPGKVGGSASEGSASESRSSAAPTRKGLGEVGKQWLDNAFKKVSKGLSSSAQKVMAKAQDAAYKILQAPVEVPKAVTKAVGEFLGKKREQLNAKYGERRADEIVTYAALGLMVGGTLAASALLLYLTNDPNAPPGSYKPTLKWVPQYDPVLKQIRMVPVWNAASEPRLTGDQILSEARNLLRGLRQVIRKTGYDPDTGEEL